MKATVIMHSTARVRHLSPTRRPRWRPAPATLACAVTLLAAAGCIKVPDVVLTDQKTALEQQAAGEFHALENDLEQAGVTPKGDDITREALEAKNPDASKSSLGEVVQLYSDVRTDREWIDQLLVAGCVGEAKSALLVQTPDNCTETVETGLLTRVVERSNQHRRQLWRMVRERNPDKSEEKVRTTWRAIHLERVVCDGQIETDAGDWERKEC